MDSQLSADIVGLDEVAAWIDGVALRVSEIIDDAADAGAALSGLCDVACEVVPTATGVFVTSTNGAAPPSVVSASDPGARRVAERMIDDGQGPVVAALVGGRDGEGGGAASSDLFADQRWPVNDPNATADARSLLAIRLHGDFDGAAIAVNWFSYAAGAFGAAAVRAAVLLARTAAGSLTAAYTRNRVVHLSRALESSRSIGAAVGILMAFGRLTQDQAFDRLRLASQRSHRKLAEIAEDVLRTGSLPGLD